MAMGSPSPEGQLHANGTRRKPGQVGFDAQWRRDHYADEFMRPDEPKADRLYSIPLGACAAAAHERNPKVKLAKFDWVLHTGGHTRAEYIAGVRAGIASEDDPEVREFAAEVLSLLEALREVAAKPGAGVATAMMGTSKARPRAYRTRRRPRSRSPGDDDPSEPPLARNPAEAGLGRGVRRGAA
jgi:hypothetical protein